MKFQVSVALGSSRSSFLGNRVHKLLHRAEQPHIRTVRPVLGDMLLHRLRFEQPGRVLRLSHARTQRRPPLRHHEAHPEQDVLHLSLSQANSRLWLLGPTRHQVTRTVPQSAKVRLLDLFYGEHSAKLCQ